MERIAIRYLIDSIQSEFLIENKFGFEIYLDQSEKGDLLSFIRQNARKFITALQCALDFKRGDYYRGGPQCTKEFRFVKNAKFNGAIKLNSRIYVIVKETKMILCHLYPKKKRDSVPKNVEKILLDRCKSTYLFKSTDKQLIDI